MCARAQLRDLYSAAVSECEPTGRPARTRFVRYAVGSALATGTSAVAFAVAYRPFHLGAALSSVAAFLAGALVNFLAGRFWAWGRRRRLGLGRDALGYGLVAVTTALAAAGVTAATEARAARVGVDDTMRTLLVEASYFAVYAATFLVKFALLDRVVFAPRSRSQVVPTTRA
jgi:putative flippase GtrA